MRPAADRLEEALLSFVRERFKASIGRTTLGPDTPLFTTGVVDSFGVLEVIAFVEHAFQVEIDLSVHELGDFDTTRRIAALVGRLTP